MTVPSVDRPAHRVKLYGLRLFVSGTTGETLCASKSLWVKSALLSELLCSNLFGQPELSLIKQKIAPWRFDHGIS